MNNRLILVEGIPGSGKTTIAYKIKEAMDSKGIKARLFNEGDSHPADLAWSACLTLEEYENILKENPDMADKIKENTRIEDDYAIVAYTKLGLPMKSKGLIEFFEGKELYDGKSSVDTFKELHLKRWRAFAESVKDDECINIFECAYLQNHVNELMSRNDQSFDDIESYMVELIDTVKELNPKLVYLTQPDIKETIRRVAEERVSPDKSKWDDWIDLVIKYVEASPYGQAKEYKGYDGCIKFIEDRKKIEEKIIADLNIDKAIVVNDQYEWDSVLADVLSHINL